MSTAQCAVNRKFRAFVAITLAKTALKLLHSTHISIANGFKAIGILSHHLNSVRSERKIRPLIYLLPCARSCRNDFYFSLFSFCVRYFLYIETPEPPKSCELRNDTYLEVVCVAGFDGGLTQHFMLEVVGGNPFYPTTYTTRSSADFMDNDLSTMNDQVGKVE